LLRLTAALSVTDSSVVFRPKTTARRSGEALKPLGRVFGSSSQDPTQTAKRRLRLRTLIILALLLFQALCVQHTADVLYAVIPSWDDPDTDDNITPLSAADMDKAHGHITVPSPRPRGSCGSSDIPGRDQNPTFSDVIARAPPVAPFHTSSLYVRLSCWSQFDLDPNGHASVRVPIVVHAIDPRLELICWQDLRRAGSEAFETKSASAAVRSELRTH